MFSHFHHIPQCPRCGRSSMVQHGDNQWTCLGCNFSRDLSKDEPMNLFAILGWAVLFALVMMQLSRIGQHPPSHNNSEGSIPEEAIAVPE